MATKQLAPARVKRVFSATLFARDLKSNAVLILVLLLIMILMCAVLTVAANLLDTQTETLEEDEQTTLFTYLGGLAAYNTTIGALTETELSADDFLNTSNHTAYEIAFTFLNANAGLDETLSIEGFENILATAQATDVGLDTYVREFEYAFALTQSEGVFSGDELDLAGLLETVFSTLGKADLMDMMEDMDTSSLLNTMYFKVIGLLPIFILVVILSNVLIASLVDKGSMAYVLSTPTKRSAVALTQMAFLLVVPAVMVALVCAENIAVTTAVAGSANAEMLVVMYSGWYLLIEAVAALCYFGSCVFNTSGRALAFGGGLAVWFFIASFLGVFGSDNFVNMGVGVEQLSVFNNLTLTNLLDITAIATIGSEAVDMSFAVGFAVFGAIAVAFYAAGAIVFSKKDLPL